MYILTADSGRYADALINDTGCVYRPSRHGSSRVLGIFEHLQVLVTFLFQSKSLHLQLRQLRLVRARSQYGRRVTYIIGAIIAALVDEKILFAHTSAGTNSQITYYLHWFSKTSAFYLARCVLLLFLIYLFFNLFLAIFVRPINSHLLDRSSPNFDGW